MVGPQRPLFVLFGSSIVQFSYSEDGWGAMLADIYARKSTLLPTIHLSSWKITNSFQLGNNSRLPPLNGGGGGISRSKADILLRGYSGWTSRRALQVVDQVFPKDAAIQPSLVIVYFGGNDSMGPHSSGLGPHVPLPEYTENMRRIAIHLKSLSENTRIIFLSCPPVNEKIISERASSYSGIFSHLDRTNEACRRYSEACLEICREMDLKAIDLWTAIQKKDDWLTACFTDGIHLSSEGSKIVVEEILRVLKEAEWEPSLHWKSLPTEFSEDSPYDLVAFDGKTTINPSEWTFHRKIQWD